MAKSRFAAIEVAVLLLVTVTAPATARADSSADEADARFQRGASLYRATRYEEALLEFLASERLVHNRNVVFNIARTYESLRRFDEAYRYYSESMSSETDETLRRALADHLSQLQAHVAVLALSSVPTGATVYVDRRDLGARGQTPLSLALPPGKHTIIVEKPGHDPMSAETVVEIGKTTSIELPLIRIVGSITIESTPRAAVRVDRADDDAGAPDGETPLRLALTPGRHSLELRAAGHLSRRREVMIEARQEASIRIELDPIPAASGTLVLQSSEPGAQIVADGTARSFAPAVLKLPVGRHRLRVEKPGYEPWEADVTVGRDQQAFLNALLLPSEAEIVGATRSAQRLSDAPASVSLVPGTRIADFGYEVLADALRAVRGFTDYDDRMYRAVGIRGFSRPGDLTNRVLILRDGHAINEDWTGAGPVGREQSVDLDDVDRIEVVRGPGSAFYGQGAFFGVVNVVSLEPGEGPAVRATSAITSEGGSRLSGRVAGRWGDSLAASLSASVYESRGRSLAIDEIADPGTTISNADAESARRVALRMRAGDFSLDASYNARGKEIPTAPYETVVDPAHFEPTGGVVTSVDDARMFVEARYRKARGGMRFEGRVYGDRTDYEGLWPYDEDAEPLVVRDHATGYWYGGEARLAVNTFGRQRLTSGIEASLHEIAQSLETAGVEDFYDRRSFWVGAAYLTDDVQLARRVQLSLGGRLDLAGGSADRDLAISPRAALVLNPYPRGRTKLIMGRAFRAPSIYELYYQDNGLTQKPAEALDPETIWTAEAEHSHSVGSRDVVTVSVFGSRIRGLINMVIDPTDELLVFQNATDTVDQVGAELEGRLGWRSGAFVSGAVSVTNLRTDDDSARTNSTPVTATLAGFLPTGQAGQGLAGELLYAAPRLARDGSRTEHMVMANAAFATMLGRSNVLLRVGVRNLLDWQYRIPVGEEFQQLGVEQDGRTFFVQLAYAR